MRGMPQNTNSPRKNAESRTVIQLRLHCSLTLNVKLPTARANVVVMTR
jgi:hypothetical protein